MLSYHDMTQRLPAEDFLDLDSQLTDDERDARDLVRRFCAKRLRDAVPAWYERGLSDIDARDIMAEFGQLGILGMHLDGYGCAGAGPVSYGLVCAELEAVDSGLRSMVSVQGSQLCSLFGTGHISWLAPRLRWRWVSSCSDRW